MIIATATELGVAMANVEYSKIPRVGGQDVLDSFVELYEVVYLEPPYEEGPEQVARFAALLPQEVERPGFDSTIAADGVHLIGAAYGWTMDAERWFLTAIHKPPRYILQCRKFAVMEWLIHPEYRGKGTGRQLITRLLTDRSEPWAVLASDPRSSARGIYRRNGWQEVGTSALPWGATMDLLALPLRPRTAGC